MKTKILKGTVYYFDGDNIQKDKIDYYDQELRLYWLKGSGNLHDGSALFKTKTELLKQI